MSRCTALPAAISWVVFVEMKRIEEGRSDIEHRQLPRVQGTHEKRRGHEISPLSQREKVGCCGGKYPRSGKSQGCMNDTQPERFVASHVSWPIHARDLRFLFDACYRRHRYGPNPIASPHSLHSNSMRDSGRRRFGGPQRRLPFSADLCFHA